MNDTLYAVLSRRWKYRDKKHPQVFRFTPKQVRNIMEDLCTRAGVKPFGYHAIRHHVRSVIDDSDRASVKQIHKLAGHKRQTTTETYLHSIGSALRDAAAILDEKSVLFEGSGTPMVRQHFEGENA